MTTYGLKSNCLNKLQPYSWWINEGLKEINSHSAGTDLLVELDTLAFNIEKNPDNYKSLEQKVQRLISALGKEKDNHIISNKGWKTLSNNEEEHRRQFFDFANELKTFETLSKEGYSNIKIVNDGPNVKKEGQKYVDLTAMKNNQNWAIEVKTIQRPREEADRLRSGVMYLSSVDESFKKPLESKLRSCLINASEKFVFYPKHEKLVIVYYGSGIQTSLYITRSISEEVTLAQVFGIEFLESLEKEYGLSILEKSLM